MLDASQNILNLDGLKYDSQALQKYNHQETLLREFLPAGFKQTTPSSGNISRNTETRPTMNFPFSSDRVVRNRVAES